MLILIITMNDKQIASQSVSPSTRPSVRKSVDKINIVLYILSLYTHTFFLKISLDFYSKKNKKKGVLIYEIISSTSGF